MASPSTVLLFCIMQVIVRMVIRPGHLGSLEEIKLSPLLNILKNQSWKLKPELPGS